jgi:hypothetical protein
MILNDHWSRERLQSRFGEGAEGLVQHHGRVLAALLEGMADDDKKMITAVTDKRIFFIIIYLLVEVCISRLIND